MIHPTADVQSSKIGENTQIWQYTVILPKAKIGKNCNINCHVFIENDVVIGDNVTVKPGVQIWDGLWIEDDVFIGPNVTFTNDLTPRSKMPPEEFAKTVVQKGASIGANATIIAGITIGEYALIGAGGLITKSIPPFTLWYGNPARHKGFVTRKGEILSINLMDTDGRQYFLEKNEPVLKER